MGDVGVLTFDLSFLHEMIFNWICVAVVAFVLYILLYKPVKEFMQARQNRIAGQLKDAEDALLKAGKLKDEYEGKLKNIEREKAEILDNARKRGSEREEQIIGEAKEEAKSIKERAMLDIQREKDKAKDEMKRQIIELSSLMAGSFVSAKLNETEANKLLDASISDLGDVIWPN